METSCEIRLVDLEDGKPKRVDLGDEPICVAMIDRQVFAVGDTCTHQNVSLSEGEIVGYDIECWLHGSRFDMRTGVPDCPPAVVSLPTYLVTIVDDLAVIERKK